ncbi:hypothetical protein CONPUDRAFT_157731 [Coniophora puteana RWD-64-598 SS2]|uniref:Uncharacterized protein n=1 Tax=Coniophora puteana (strain RWD-64-598) TaxID=741705 RepID=A0A5M3MBT4_CONPW|nr:uncharacterized protein CONPUDRAFT_157731 [Coniophora puteana RWD-64-598 SS2]EIW76543.1 hypothetical protein CONPUDRAFT_157731 [Coniophora puteana RWD-64-598 SS2]
MAQAPPRRSTRTTHARNTSTSTRAEPQPPLPQGPLMHHRKNQSAVSVTEEVEQGLSLDKSRKLTAPQPKAPTSRLKSTAAPKAPASQAKPTTVPKAPTKPMSTAKARTTKAAAQPKPAPQPRELPELTPRVAEIEAKMANAQVPKGKPKPKLKKVPSVPETPDSVPDAPVEPALLTRPTAVSAAAAKRLGQKVIDRNMEREEENDRHRDVEEDSSEKEFHQDEVENGTGDKLSRIYYYQHLLINDHHDLMLLSLTESTLYWRDMALAIYSGPATFDDFRPRINTWKANIPRSASTSITSRTKSSASRRSVITKASSFTTISSRASTPHVSAKGVPASAGSSRELCHGIRDEDDTEDVEREGASMWNIDGKGVKSAVSIERPASNSTSTPLGPPYTQIPCTSPEVQESRKRSRPDDTHSDSELSEQEHPYEPAEYNDTNPEADYDETHPNANYNEASAEADYDDTNPEAEDAGADPTASSHVDGDDLAVGMDVSTNVDGLEASPDGHPDDETMDQAAEDVQDGEEAVEQDHGVDEGDDGNQGDAHAADGTEQPGVVNEDGSTEEGEQGETLVPAFGQKRTTASMHAKASTPSLHRPSKRARMERPARTGTPAANGDKKPGKPRVSDLPLECRTSDKLFSATLMPTVCLWMGECDQPWNPSDEVIEDVCAKIYPVVFGREYSDLEESERSTLLSIVCERLCGWRNNFGSTAVAALLVLMGGRGLFDDKDRRQFCQQLLVEGAFLYERIVDGKPINIFQGSYFVIVLSCHFQAIQGHVDVPAFKRLTTPQYLPRGAFGLAAAACVRAINMVIQGKMGDINKSLNGIVQAGCSPESGWDGVCKAKRLISAANRKPRVEKKRSSKKVKSTPEFPPPPPFSEANYGSITKDLYESAMREKAQLHVVASWDRAIEHILSSGTAEDDAAEESADDSNDKARRSMFFYLPLQSPPSVPVSSRLVDDPHSQSSTPDKLLMNAADNLEARGVLHKRNRLQIDELLTMSKITDDEIFEAEVKAWEARDNMESTGTDAVDDEGDVIEELPGLERSFKSRV